jgi:hypothetical protein
MSPVARMGWVDRAFCHLASLNQSLGTKRSASKCQVAQLAALIGLFRIGGPSCFRTNHQTKSGPSSANTGARTHQLSFASLNDFQELQPGLRQNLHCQSVIWCYRERCWTLCSVIGTTEDLASQLPQSNKVDCTDSTSLPETCP